MKHIRITEAEFAALLGAFTEDRSRRLEEAEALWCGQVPESVRRAAGAALCEIRAGAVPRGLRLPSGRALLLGAAAVLAAAGAVTGAARYALPALREAAAVEQSVTGVPAWSVRSPRDYIVPSPGEEFTVREETESGHMLYVWFDGGRKQVLVEIAEELPADAAQTGITEPVTAGGVPGTWCGDDRSLSLYDGENHIYIRYWNGTREDALDYAALLLEANP